MHWSALEQAPGAWWDGHKGLHPALLSEEPMFGSGFGGVEQGSSLNPCFAGSRRCKGKLGKHQANPTSTSI